MKTILQEQILIVTLGFHAIEKMQQAEVVFISRERVLVIEKQGAFVYIKLFVICGQRYWLPQKVKLYRLLIVF